METLKLKELSELLQSETTAKLPKRNDLLNKFASGSLLLVSDMILLTFSIIITILLRDALLPGYVDFSFYLPSIPIVLPLFAVLYFSQGLYPGFGIDVVSELRKLTYSTTIVFIALAVFAFFIKDNFLYSRLVFLVSWIISLITVPLGRAVIKKVFGKKSWWGVPVIVIGAGKAGEKVIKSMLEHSQIGLKPIVAVDDDIDRWGYSYKIPVIGGLELIPQLAKRLKIDHAIFAMPSVQSDRQKELITKYSGYFTHTIIIPDIFGFSSVWVSSRDIGGILGLEVQQKLLNKTALLRKRIFDILLISVLGILALPLMLIVSAMIYLDSKGRVLFRQVRMGKDDSRFEIIKFRTMHTDAENRLNNILDENADLKREYEIYHKLRDDPRKTRIGKFLRKFSIDEVPQFINVLRGEMSLIGPRAYMPWEKYKMNGMDKIILKVKPGISGLWQVTGRLTYSFEERNITDVYYVRNWSIFLDIYIVAKTIGVVFTGKGE